QRCKGQKQVGRALPFVFAVDPQRLSSAHRQRFTRLGQQLLAGLIGANEFVSRCIGGLIQIQNLFHLRYERGVGLRRNAPLLFEPRLKFVFFNPSRTVSSEMCSTMSNATRRSASSCS